MARKSFKEIKQIVTERREAEGVRPISDADMTMSSPVSADEFIAKLQKRLGDTGAA
jgi:hypothetical protein